MGHLENKLEWCLRKAKKEGEKHRGLKEVKPDEDNANRHIAKAEHNRKAMGYLIEGNFPDWAVNASFYSMYHCLLALVSKFGYESRNQECTFTVVEYLIKNNKINLDIKWLNKIGSFDEDKLEDEGIIKLREKFQYGIGTTVDNSKIKQLVGDTTEFIDVVREVLKK